jgi:threonine dehydrogenase-like Zn-dependent dehydrogenase
MRAIVISAPGQADVVDVAPPMARPGEVVVSVARAGLCGTDRECFTGDMAYLQDGRATYPLRIGHEWSGVVATVGDGVDPGWIGRRVTGDPMLGCGRCHRCRTRRAYLCETRFEVGLRGGWPGALAEQVAVPVGSVHPLPLGVDDVMGALVEPGANAFRAVSAAGLGRGHSVLIVGAGTIGLLAAEFAMADGAEVHLLTRSARSYESALSLFDRTDETGGGDVQVVNPRIWRTSVPSMTFDAVIDASDDPAAPALAIELVEPGRRVVFVGLAGSRSPVDARAITLKDVTAVGILGGSAAFADVIVRYATSAFDPRRVIGATVGLSDVSAVLQGWRPAESEFGPKILVDPSREHGSTSSG